MGGQQSSLAAGLTAATKAPLRVLGAVSVGAVSDVREQVSADGYSFFGDGRKQRGSAVFKVYWRWHDVCHIEPESFIPSFDGEPP